MPDNDVGVCGAIILPPLGCVEPDGHMTPHKSLADIFQEERDQARQRVEELEAQVQDLGFRHSLNLGYSVCRGCSARQDYGWDEHQDDCWVAKALAAKPAKQGQAR